MSNEKQKTLADLIAARFAEPTTSGSAMPATGTLALQLSHRTHRRYEDRPIPEELTQVILAAALSAPAKSDLQQVSIVRVSNPDLRARIAGLIPDMPWIASAPEFFVFCGDSRRIRRVCEMRGHPFANDHLDAFLNAASDTAMVLQSTVTAAEACGLGCCPISVIRNHIEEVARLLELPEWVFPLAGLCIGYPKQQGYVSVRLSPSITVHQDRYDDSRLAEEIDAYDRRRDAVYHIPAEKQRDRSTLGEAEFYGWSEDKARQVSHVERRSLAAFLRGQGFNLD